MPKPFPLPISVGTDICSSTRILSILTKKPHSASQFLARVFGEKERVSIPRTRVEGPLDKYWGLVDRREEVRGLERLVKSGRWRKVGVRWGWTEIKGLVGEVKGREEENSVKRVYREVLGRRVREREILPMVDLKSGVVKGKDGKINEINEGKGSIPATGENAEVSRAETHSDFMLLKQASMFSSQTSDTLKDTSGEDIFADTLFISGDRNAAGEGVISKFVETDEEIYLDPEAASGKEQETRRAEESVITQEIDSKGNIRAVPESAAGEEQEATTPNGKVNEATSPQVDTNSLIHDLSTIIGQLKRSAEWVAGRYAAKEAAIKAHRSRNLTFHDIWIKASGRVEGRSVAPETLIISEGGSWKNAQVVPMNISHDSGYATAVCLATEQVDEVDGNKGDSRGSIIDPAQLVEITNSAGSELAAALHHQRKNGPAPKPEYQNISEKVPLVSSGTKSEDPLEGDRENIGHPVSSSADALPATGNCDGQLKIWRTPYPEDQSISLNVHRVNSKVPNWKRDQVESMHLQNKHVASKFRRPRETEVSSNARFVESKSAKECGITWLAELLVQSGNQESARQRAEALVTKIEENPAVVNEIFGREWPFPPATSTAFPSTSSSDQRGTDAHPLTGRKIGRISGTVRIVNVTPYESEKIGQLKRTAKENMIYQREINQKLKDLKVKLAKVTGGSAAADDGMPAVRQTNTTPATVMVERARRTIFIGGLSPWTRIQDLHNAFREFSADTRCHIYTNMAGARLGTAAVVMETSEDARRARLAKHNTELRGNIIRCMPFFSKSYREFLLRVIKRDAVWLQPPPKIAAGIPAEKPIEEPEEEIEEEEEEEIQEDSEPRPLLEREPLPEPSSSQYILVRELFHIQEEYFRRRARRIYISNVNKEATEEDIKGLFEGYEHVEVSLRRRSTGESLGSASVIFQDEADASRARSQTDGNLFMGQDIRCKEYGEKRRRYERVGLAGEKDSM